MAERADVMEFLAKSKTDAKLGEKILKVFEAQGIESANQIMKIAHDEGFAFSQVEFEAGVRESIAATFSGGKQADETPEGGVERARPRPPMSTCARGCLSYTVNWHPVDPFE